MAGVRTMIVAAADDGLRLDRWFKQHFPALSHGRLQKLLRTGQVRVDGGRAKAGTRLAAGQEVRLPPQVAAAPDGDAPSVVGAGTSQRKNRPRPEEVAEIVARVLYRDDEVLVLNKPSGLAVQGGSGVRLHVDALLDDLRFGADERPRLVHRLDKDTSGVLVLARTRAAARWLTGAFRGKAVHKLYWAAVAGVPEIPEGVIDLPLGKGGAGVEKMTAAAERARSAITRYRVLDRVGERAAWLAMEPVTGRTHQLRAHAAAIGTPILGDGKYGGRAAFPEGLDLPRQVHLHARRISLAGPGGAMVDVVAPIPDHMRETWKRLGFEITKEMDDLFLEYPL